jgi:TDG/mug DNA glycosylase family protein
MDVLPDILRPGLDVVFCGTAVGECSARRGHYYAGPGNAFWRLLHEAGFTDHRLDPTDDVTLPDLGYGLTDIVKDVTRMEPGRRFDVPTLVAKLEAHRPGWLALTGKAAGHAVARALGHPSPALGPQRWTVAGAEVFVLPSSSGANQRREYDGRPTRLAWWAELAALCR